MDLKSQDEKVELLFLRKVVSCFFLNFYFLFSSSSCTCSHCLQYNFFQTIMRGPSNNKRFFFAYSVVCFAKADFYSGETESQV